MVLMRMVGQSVTRIKEIPMKMARVLATAMLVAGTGLPLDTVRAQQAGVTRTPLQRHDLSTPGREMVQVRVDLAPGVTFPPHSHPGEEIVYVIEGVLEYRIEGKPSVTLKAGEVLFIPAGAVHGVTNVGSTNAAELATYIVDKGKPLVVLK
jgi:quercetin dioxygenase-like cupin family protein